jgi:hypothetical protein
VREGHSELGEMRGGLQFRGKLADVDQDKWREIV